MILTKLIDFILQGTESRRKIHLVDWKGLCKHKDVGGLGVRKAASMNKALLMKLAWRFMQDAGSLWVIMLKARYHYSMVDKKFGKGASGSSSGYNFWDESFKKKIFPGELGMVIQCCFGKMYGLMLAA